MINDSVKVSEDTNVDFESIKIGLASPETIRSWSMGEVIKAETINYRTLKPEKDGLFCERIFGPTKSYECCAKHKKTNERNKICPKCGVEITDSKVRRERMGHIELASPVAHIWYVKGTPSRIGLMLDISLKDLESVLYFQKYIVVDLGKKGEFLDVKKGDVIDEKRYEEIKTNLKDYYDDTTFVAERGAEAIKKLLSEIDVEVLCKELREEMETAAGQKKKRILKRLEVAEAFRSSGNKPEWMVLDTIPVIPPDIRPMVQLDGGRFAASDLNDLYRRVINRNNRLKEFMEIKAPALIINNEKRMLQEAVDALIDNSRRSRPVTGPNNRPLKSLTDMLKGKQGRFRQNLLGKRVDYSGRSVIVVGPELKLYQCGLPKEMALELFKPFVMKRLQDLNGDINIKSARRKVEKGGNDVWDALEVVIKDHPVMLNRAPTLHRLGIQAFEPVLVEGRAIKLHPLVCTAFNADFDGDQMAVHVPLSAEAQAEARFLMLASNNLLKPSDGKPVVVPTQDMILGSYYLTLEKEDDVGHGKVFRNVDEAMMAYDEGDLSIHAPIKIRMTKEVDGEVYSHLLETTLGKVIFNTPVPQDLGFVDRSNPDNMFKLEINELVNKKVLGRIIERCIRVHGTAKSAVVLDNIKAQGYKYSTRSGITVAVCDATIPEKKAQYLKETEAVIDVIESDYQMGLSSAEDRSRAIIKAWEKCTAKVSAELRDAMDKYNPIYMMLDSGARGSDSQLRQLAGMRGLIANTAGKTIEIPIRANYREGLNIIEYFISSRGARKGLADTALRTADSGYLTRRLVDVSQDVIIREEDCHCKNGLDVYDIMDDADVIEPLSERLTGRYLLEDFFDDETGELICDKDTVVTEALAKRIADKVNSRENPEDRKIKIRSLLTCDCERGVCIKCYGTNLATAGPVTIGEAVGIIAAQSIGEPGTQLTMRTFHTGGVASQADITQGLPRVEELFEGRKPKIKTILSEIDGVVSFDENKKSTSVVVTGTEDVKSYPIRFDDRLCQDIVEGAMVKKGQHITEGVEHPQDVLAILGVEAVHNYLIKEVQKTYRLQGVDINDKHIEVIVRQMMRRVTVKNAGSTDLLEDISISKQEFRESNRAAEERCKAEGKEFVPATAEATLLGITKAALATDSFLSAASFQETSKVLTEAAIRGKVDKLQGLKENVIIGKLLPSGTGMQCYSDVNYEAVREDAGFNSIEIPMMN